MEGQLLSERGQGLALQRTRLSRGGPSQAQFPIHAVEARADALALGPCDPIRVIKLREQEQSICRQGFAQDRVAVQS